MDADTATVAAPGGVTFTYLYDRDGIHEKSDVLSENVSAADVGFVVRDEAARKYRLFSSPEAFWDWAGTVSPENRCFHEVIFGTHAQRIKFDIDAECSKIGLVPQRLVDQWRHNTASYTSEQAEQALEELLFGDFMEVESPGLSVSSGPNAAQPVPGSPVEQCLALVDYLASVIVDAFHAAYFDSGAVLTADQILVASSLGVPWGEFKAGKAMPDKFSFHIIVVPFALANHREAREFTKSVLTMVEAEMPEILPLIDPSVNDSTQNFRLLGSHKAGGRRTKVVDTRLAAELDTMALDPKKGAGAARRLLQIGRPTNVRVLPAQCDDEAPPSVTLASADVNAALECVYEHMPDARSHHHFTRSIGSLMLFERKLPSFCRICQRIHDNDNSLMVAVRPDTDDERVATLTDGDVTSASSPPGAQRGVLVELCRRAQNRRGRVIATFMCGPGTFANTPTERGKQAELKKEERLKAVISALNEGRRDASQSRDRMFELNCPATHYSEPAMRDYEHVKTLAVMAQMGLGKTRALRRYIETHFSRSPGMAGATLARPIVIRFVTFRQTFSESLRKSFEGFDLYSDISSHTIRSHAHPRLIIQVESLHRLLGDVRSGGIEPDLLVLDEVESVLAQFSSGLHKSFHESFAVFQWLVSQSKHVVCMDANLSDRTYRTLIAMRPHAPPHFHHNGYMRAAESTMHLTSRRDDWLAHLVTQVGNGKRIALASNSRREASSIQRILAARYPDKTIRIYSSETPQAERVLHFADVNTYWRDLDVLIYTPTVSAGVSYEVGCDTFDPAVATPMPQSPVPGESDTIPLIPESLGTSGVFDCMYVYLSDMSCDVETGRQMLGRVRVLRDRDYFVCISSIPRSHPTDIGTLERLAYDQRRALQDSAWTGLNGVSPARFRFDPQTGNIQPYRTPYFALWLENNRIANLSRNAYGERFADQVFLTGARLRWLEPLVGAEETASIASARNTATRELRDQEIEGIVSAPDFTAEEVREVRRRQESTETNVAPVSDSGLRGVDRFYLRQRFHWSGEMTPALVSKMMRPSVQRIFSNLEVAMSAPTIEEALEALRTKELSFYEATVTCSAPNVCTNAAQRLEHADIRHRYKYPGHYYMLHMLQLCGFKSLNDPSALPEMWVLAQLWAARVTIGRILTLIVETLQVRRPPIRSLSSTDLEEAGRSALRLVNSGLRKMYGVELKLNKSRGTLQLNPTAEGRMVWPALDEGTTTQTQVDAPRVKSQLRPILADVPAIAVIHFYYQELDRRGELPITPLYDTSAVHYTWHAESLWQLISGGSQMLTASLAPCEMEGTKRAPSRDLIELAKLYINK